MKIKTLIYAVVVISSSSLVLGCSSMSSEGTSTRKNESGMTNSMAMGNSDNVKVISNPTMMLHDIVVTDSAGNTELVGKIHMKGHQDYLPGHIDIVAIDKATGKTISAVSTDFNSRIARHGRYNLHHPNNISTMLPGVNPETAEFVIAYHYSNINRFSKVDCGANVALAATHK